MTPIRPLAIATGSAVLAALALAGTADAAGTYYTNFTQPGQHAVRVPAGIQSIDVDAVGGHGGAGARPEGSSLAGGRGGEVTGTVRVTPTRTYGIEVGYGGGAGGLGRFAGGAGGGASAFRACDIATPRCSAPSEGLRLIVAAGGGGTAGGNATISGRGGNADAPGEAGEWSPYDPIRSTGGFLGTQSWGGAGGAGQGGNGAQGAAALGGKGGGLAAGYAGGGGGGGGWYGGGGGAGSALQVPVSGGGGGGGSNHVDTSKVTDATVSLALSRDPSVSLSWFDDVAPTPTLEAPANETQPTLRGKAGRELGDSATVTVAIYKSSSHELAQTLEATSDGNGDWSVPARPLEPGTYSAVVTQRDAVANSGSSSPVPFLVPQATPSPTPMPTPTPKPLTTAAVEPPAVTTAPSQRSAAVLAPASVRILTTRARFTRGTLMVRLTCAGPLGQRCRGVLTLTAKLGTRTRVVGSARYATTAGQASTVRVRIRTATRLRRVVATAGTAKRVISIA
jgi:hypothetical protein